MKGTEKQVAWAEDIKAAVTATMEAMLAMTANDPRSATAEAQAQRAKVARALESVKACDNAHDLIEVYQGASTTKSERANLEVVVSRLRNRFRIEFTKAQNALRGEQ